MLSGKVLFQIFNLIYSMYTTDSWLLIFFCFIKLFASIWHTNKTKYHAKLKGAENFHFNWWWWWWWCLVGSFCCLPAGNTSKQLFTTTSLVVADIAKFIVTQFRVICLILFFFFSLSFQAFVSSLFGFEVANSVASFKLKLKTTTTTFGWPKALTRQVLSSLLLWFWNIFTCSTKEREEIARNSISQTKIFLNNNNNDSDNDYCFCFKQW